MALASGWVGIVTISGIQEGGRNGSRKVHFGQVTLIKLGRGCWIGEKPGTITDL